MSDDEVFAYVAVKKEPEKGAISPAFACGDLAYVRKVRESWEAGQDPKEEDESSEEPELALESAKEAALASALKRAVDYARSQSHLVGLSEVAPLVLSGVSFERDVLGPIRQTTRLFEEASVCDTYALTYEEWQRFEEARKKANDVVAGYASLPSATLMSFVATFDALMVDVLGQLLALEREWMKRSDRQISFSKLAAADNLQELVEDAISDELYQFSRGSHDEQAKYIETNFGVSIRSSWKRWPDYIEVFERRNLIAHGEKSFNKRYVALCEKAGHKGSAELLGKPVELRPRYLRQALDVLVEFAVLLPFTLWRKFEKSSEEKAFTQLNESAYSLILNRRYVLAARILEFALSLTKVDVPISTIHMLTINHASALRHAGFKDQAEKVLASVDWSASSDIFKICMHAVRENAEDVAALIKPLVVSERISATTIRTWPCFSFVRDDPAVRQSFEEAFGEPLSAPSRQTPGEQVSTSPEESTSKTVH